MLQLWSKQGRKAGEVAEEASRSIWRWSAIKEWGKDKRS